MNFLTLLSIASIPTVALAGIIWLLRNIIITRLTNSVRYEFEQKIEKLKSSLRQNETSFKIDLETKNKEIETLRNSVLSSISNHQIALNQRRVIAVEQLWVEVESLAAAKHVSRIMSRVNIPKIEKEIKQKTVTGKSFIEDMVKISGNFDITKLPHSNGAAIRPFVSPLSWSLFSAYKAIIQRSCLQLEFLKKGLTTEFIDSKNVANLIEVALPHQKPVIERYGVDTGFIFLEEIEIALLKDLDSTLRGEKYDKQNIKRATAILEESNAIMAANATQMQN